MHSCAAFLKVATKATIRCWDGQTFHRGTGSRKRRPAVFCAGLSYHSVHGSDSKKEYYGGKNSQEVVVTAKMALKEIRDNSKQPNYAAKNERINTLNKIINFYFFYRLYVSAYVSKASACVSKIDGIHNKLVCACVPPSRLLRLSTGVLVKVPRCQQHLRQVGPLSSLLGMTPQDGYSKGDPVEHDDAVAGPPESRHCENHH